MGREREREERLGERERGWKRQAEREGGYSINSLQKMQLSCSIFSDYGYHAQSSISISPATKIKRSGDHFLWGFIINFQVRSMVDRSVERYWHERCLKCCMCGLQMTDRCYEKGGRFYCPTDYYRWDSTTCSLMSAIIFNVYNIVRRERVHWIWLPPGTPLSCLDRSLPFYMGVNQN